MAPRVRNPKAAKLTAETNTQGVSGTAREAPSADSGGEASEVGDGPDDEDAAFGTQSAPPTPILEPQQPAEMAGAVAEPEAEIAVVHGNAVALAPESAASGQAGLAPETGEATGSGGPAAAAPDAELELMFEVASRVKRGGRYHEAGEDVPLTKDEHRALHSLGVVLDDWPD